MQQELHMVRQLNILLMMVVEVRLMQVVMLVQTRINLKMYFQSLMGLLQMVSGSF